MNYFDGINYLLFGESPNYQYPVSDHSPNGYYALQYNHSGSLLYSSDLCSEIQIDEPCAFVTFPGVTFNFAPLPGEERHHMYVGFNGPRVNAFLAGGLLERRADAPIIISQSDKFYEQFLELQESLRAVPQNTARANHLLEGLLLQIQGEKKEAKPRGTQGHKELVKLGEDIRKMPELDWDFKKEAKNLNVSYVHFRRLFKATMGCSPGQLVLKYRLDAAAERLLATDLPLAQIAEDLNFYDVHHFSKLFKRQFDMPPATYRRELR